MCINTVAGKLLGSDLLAPDDLCHCEDPFAFDRNSGDRLTAEGPAYSLVSQAEKGPEREVHLFA